jgi:Glycosyl transferase family 2
MKEVTVVLTACNRPDLLKKTLDSFFEKNTYPITRFIITEDGGSMDCNDFVIEQYPSTQFELMYNAVHLGQIRTIDLAYARVKTPYIFHMEEDWIFLKSGFVETSMDIMETDPNIITVWLRSPEDETLKHLYLDEVYTTESGIQYKKCDVPYPRDKGLWNGFTLNPSLKRLLDYKKVQPYQDLPRLTPVHLSGGNPLECDISVAYAQLGYYAVTVLEQYIEHIGWDRHI